MLRFFTILVFLAAAAPAWADFAAGKAAYDKKDWAVAVRELRPLAEAGDDRAMILLGNMYNEGLGVIISKSEALSLYKRAATEKNNTQAMDAVGALYISGVGMPQNLSTALQWFERSAKLGDPRGAFFTATLLFRGNKTAGDEIKPDIYKAYVWYKIAAAGDDADYKAMAEKMAQALAAKMLKADEVAKADAEAAAFKPVSAAELGSAPADPTMDAPSPESQDTSSTRPGPSATP